MFFFVPPRSRSGPHLWLNGHPGHAAAWRGSALWTCRTASDRKPADASWPPNEQLLSDRTQPQRGRTASKSTSLKPKHGFEVHRILLSSSRPPPRPAPVLSTNPSARPLLPPAGATLSKDYPKVTHCFLFTWTKAASKTQTIGLIFYDSLNILGLKMTNWIRKHKKCLSC